MKWLDIGAGSRKRLGMDRDSSHGHASGGDPSLAVSVGESLKQTAKRLQRALKDSDVAVSIEVMKMAEAWDAFREEAGGLEIDAWLVREVDPNRNFDWYRKLAEASEWLGAAIAGNLRSDALRWLWNRVRPSNAKLDTIRQLLRAEWKRNREAPVGLSQVRRICAEYVARKPEGKRGIALREAREALGRSEQRIGRLEAQVRELGGEPIE